MPDYIFLEEPTTGFDLVTTASPRDPDPGPAGVMTRIQKGQGTLARLTSDSTRYTETTATLVELGTLIADVRVSPRKYVRFSVF